MSLVLNSSLIPENAGRIRWPTLKTIMARALESALEEEMSEHQPRTAGPQRNPFPHNEIHKVCAIRLPFSAATLLSNTATGTGSPYVAEAR